MKSHGGRSRTLVVIVRLIALILSKPRRRLNIVLMGLLSKIRAIEIPPLMRAMVLVRLRKLAHEG